MYAVFETGGKQFRAEKGDELFIERLNADEGDTVTFDDVLMLGGEKTVIGNPTVEGAKVEGKVLKQGKARKITVYKYKPKKNYHRKQGHRQPYTKVQITNIITG